MPQAEAEVSTRSSTEVGSLPPVTLLIPAYNEERGIGPVLEQVKKLGLPGEIIVVDDGSTDKTFEAAQVPGITVLRHDVNRGYGQSLKTGILASKYDIIVITDADGTYPNEDIAKLLSHMPYYDMVVGARTGKTVKIRINDRGPFAGNRIIDLSTHVAEVLGIKSRGLGQVRVRYAGLGAPTSDRRVIASKKKIQDDDDDDKPKRKQAKSKGKAKEA